MRRSRRRCGNWLKPHNLAPGSATSPALLRRTIVTMVVLREFLYRRDDLVAQFLQQLEGGEYDEERIKDQRTRTSGASASAGIGSLGLSGERRADGTSETELTMRQTAASRFNRLHALLHQKEAIQPLHALDDAIWEQIARNEVVEVEATLTLLPGVAEMHQVAGIDAVLPLIETIKDLPDELLPDTVDRREADKMSSQIPAMQAVAQGLASGPVPCTFGPAGFPRYKFFSELRMDGLDCEIADLEGDVTVLAKLTRKIERGRPETVGQPGPGMQLNREQRRKGAPSTPFTMRLQHPAAIVTTIGIYR